MLRTRHCFAAYGGSRSLAANITQGFRTWARLGSRSPALECRKGYAAFCSLADVLITSMLFYSSASYNAAGQSPPSRSRHRPKLSSSSLNHHRPGQSQSHANTKRRTGDQKQRNKDQHHHCRDLRVMQRVIKDQQNHQ